MNMETRLYDDQSVTNSEVSNQDPSVSLFLRAEHGIGDNLMVTAVIEAIKREYPNIRIFVLAKHVDVFVNNPHIVACYDLHVVKKNPSLYKRALHLAYRSYNVQSQGKAKVQHFIDDIYDKIPLSISHRLYRPRIYLTEKERLYRRRKIERLARPLIAIAPYGKRRSKIPNKIYPVSRWKEVVNLLLNESLDVIQVGQRSEGRLLHGARDWRNLGYRHTAVVLSHCDAVITHVGGIMHLATACKTPCVVLYAGVEDPKVSGYSQNLNLYIDIDCAPCWRQELCTTHECIEQLTPERIVSNTMDWVTRKTIRIRNSNRAIDKV